MTAYRGSDLHVALLLPFKDGSGEHAILGVYEDEAAAQARCWRVLQHLGYDQPTAVVSVLLDIDYEPESEP